MSSVFLNISQNKALWNECIKIYRDSFSLLEREDEKSIFKNIKNNSYRMFAYKKSGEIVGFYILDVNLSLNYALLSFLAIKASQRGLGLGSQLCLHAIKHFQKHIACDYLFIEAQVRQEKLYTRLGFKTLEFDYRVPAFNSKESIKMSLMLIKEKSIDKNFLRPIIKDIFIRGYSLQEDDIRLSKQLKSL